MNNRARSDLQKHTPPAKAGQLGAEGVQLPPSDEKGLLSMPSEYSQRARIGGLARSAAAESGTAMTDRARSAFKNSFYEATDPELPEKERQRQADAAYRLHMTRLSQRAAVARRRAAAAQREAIDAEAALIVADGHAV